MPPGRSAGHEGDEFQLTEIQQSIHSITADLIPRGRPLDALARASASRPESTLRRLLALADCLAIVAALLAAFFVGSTARPSGSQLALGLLSIPVWIVLFKLYGLYDRDGNRVSHSTVDDVPWTFHALVVGGLGLFLAYKALPVEALTFAQGVTFFVVGWLGLLSARAGARKLSAVATAPERVILVGRGSLSRLLVDKIRRHPEYRLELIGYIDDSRLAADSEADLPCLGRSEELERICAERAVDRVIVVTPALEGDALADVIRRTMGLSVRVSVIPHVVDVLGPSVEIDDVEGVTVLGINPPALTRSSRFLKRAMDFVIASTVLLVALPVMAVVAVLVKATSPGPILYSQERIGRAGRRFRIRKFRTMVQDAEDKAEELRQFSAHSAWLLLEHDPRITRIGGFLRHTSMDELPQLWNVITGDMSLVGPRPMPPDVDELISGWGRRRLDLTPGVTGLWQVLGRTDIPFEEMLKLDYLYVTNWSLWRDARLLIQTLPVVLRRRGVN
jgi:exopolysaccharide biosynthesis polyprenyl glycosylphosphotransferase